MNNWKETTLGEIGKVVTGKTPPTSNLDFYGDAYPFITPTDIKDGLNYCITERHLSEEGKKYQKSILLPKNSVCYTCIASIGKICLTMHESFTNQQINSIIVDENKAHYKFIFYLLKYLTPQIKKMAGGTITGIINKNQFENFIFEIPESIEEQKEIAKVLSSLDDKIELLREQNKTLEATAQTIFKEWFVNFNFPDENGKPYKDAGGKMIDSELGEIPEGWKVGKLGDEFEIIMGQSPSGESYNEKGNGMIFFQGRAEFQERFPKIRLYTTEPKRFAEKFDVLVSVRAPVGDINVAFDKCCIGRGVGAVRSGQKSYSLYKIMSLKEDFDKFEAEGTVFGSINKDGFLNIKVVISPREIVKNFEEVASSIDQKIFNNYSQIKTLSHLRDTLMPKLMSGNVMINN